MEEEESMPTWDPFREMEALRREIDRAFANAQVGGTNGGGRVAFLPGRSARTYPFVNLTEDRDNFYVEALAPGVDPQSLDLSVVRNTLTLSGEKTGPRDVPAEAYHRSERAAGKFVRTVELPTEVDHEKVKAQYTNGLLLITLPKAEIAKPRQVQVAVS
jgi:HSP20 family protein